MLTLTRTQLRRLDVLCDQAFEERLYRVLESVCVQPGTRAPDVADLADLMRKARDQARGMGIVDAAGVAALAACFVGYARLADDEASVFRTAVAPVFAREGSDGLAALGLARFRLQALAREHAFAARLLAQVDQVRRAFE